MTMAQQKKHFAIVFASTNRKVARSGNKPVDLPSVKQRVAAHKATRRGKKHLPNG